MFDQQRQFCNTSVGASLLHAPWCADLGIDDDAFINELCSRVDTGDICLAVPCSPGLSDSLFPLDSLLQDASFPSAPLMPLAPSPTTPIHPSYPSSTTSSHNLLTDCIFTQQAQPHSSPPSDNTPTQHLPLPPQTLQHPPPRSPSQASETGSPPLPDPLNPALTLRPSHSQPPTPHPPHPTPPAAAPRATPRARRKKLRPSDRLTTLQKHLDTISSQVTHLTLRNRQLWKTKHVLDRFAQGLATCETLSARIKVDIANSRADPTAPLDGPARFCNWTPEQFAEMYRGHVVKMGESIVQMEAASGAAGTASLEAMAELAAAHEWSMEAIMYAVHGRFDFMPRVMVEQLQFLPSTVSEELHWAAVLAAMELTEGQVEDLLVAREVFLRCSQNLEQEQDTHQARLELGSPQQVADTSSAQATTGVEHITKLATNLGKQQTLAMVLYLFWFHHTLTPLQVARANIHAYPLFPCPAMLMNTLSALRGQATSETLQGPALGLFGTVRSVSGLAEHMLMASHPPTGTSLPAAAPGALE